MEQLIFVALDRQKCEGKNVNHIPVKVANRLNVLSMIGPASVVMTIFALVIKESPFYIDLSATALIGVLLCWRLKSVGLYLASALLGTVLAYNFFLDGVPLTMWEAGLGASLELTFVLTALASLELTDAFHQACKTVSANALDEVEEWKVKISETLAGKAAAVSESEEFKNKLLKLQDALKAKTEQSEMFERLLEMARTDMNQAAASKESSDRQYLEQKNLALSFEATATDLNTFISLQAEEITETRVLISRLENELTAAHSDLTSKNTLLQKQALCVMDLEWKLELVAEDIQAIERHKAAPDSQEKLAEVTVELERYKSVADEATNELALLKLRSDESSEKLEKATKEYELQKSLADESSERLQELERKIAESDQELAQYKSMASDSAGKVEALGQQLEDLIDRLKNLQTENDQLKEEIDAALKPEDAPVEPSDSKELNRVQGLYSQLRSQFSEKSQNLDDTRKLLFHSQENLLALQKEIEEKYVYEQDQTVAVYEKHNVELTAQVKQLESEVTQLEDLVKSQAQTPTKPAPVKVPVKVQPLQKTPVKVQVLPKAQTPVKVQVSPKPKKVQIKEKK